MTEDIALRVGLAARLLPDGQPATLLRVLADAVGLPPTAETLERMKVKDLKSGAGGELADVDGRLLKDVLAVLRGELQAGHGPPPAVDARAAPTSSASIRVACTSNSGEMIDGHFGACQRFLIYQVSATEARLIDCREIDDATADGPDRNSYRANLIADCQVLLTVSIGGPAAAKVVKRNVHPIKYPEGGAAPECIAKLQGILADKPPPWLAKAMGMAPDARVRFELADGDA